jgi:hypothetical protein
MDDSQGASGLTRPVARAVDGVSRITAVDPPGDDLPERLLKSLGDALRSEGFGSLAQDGSPLGARFVGVIAKAVVAVGLLAVVVLQMDLEPTLGDALLVASLFLLIYTCLEFLTFPGHPQRFWGIYLYLALWAGGGVWETTSYGLMSVTASHVAPVVGGIVLARLTSEPGTLKRVGRTLWDALRRVPLAIPVTMLILFAVMLTSEVWEAAYKQSPERLAGLAAVAILPQLVFLVVRLIRTIPDDFREVADELDDDRGKQDKDGRSLLAVTTIDRMRRINGKRRAQWFERDTELMLEASFEGQRFRLWADDICKEVRRRMRARIAVRLVLTAVGVGALVFLYVYSILVLTVDEDTGRAWSKIPATEPHDDWVLGLPGSPYVNVALVLAIVAAAVFLAFVVTGKELVVNLSRDYVHEPAETILLLAVASSALAEAFPAAGDEAPDEGERAAPPPATPQPAPG